MIGVSGEETLMKTDERGTAMPKNQQEQ